MPTDRARQPRTVSLSACAAQQHGLFTTAQARAAGYSQGAIKYRVQSGAWRSVDHGVYTTSETPISWHRRVLAACLAGPAIASHRSAGALWGIPGFSRSVVEVTALRHRRRHTTDVIWHESVRLDDGETFVIDDIPVTDATRMVIDLSAVCDDGTLLEALDDVLRRNLATVAAIQKRLDRIGGWRRGSARLRRVLARRSDRSPVPESVLESRFDVLISAARLPSPVRQYSVRDREGNLVARVDFAYPKVSLAIEIDGLRWHAGAAWEQDLARQNLISRLGWRILRFTASDLELRPRHVADSIRQALATTMRL